MVKAPPPRFRLHGSHELHRKIPHNDLGRLIAHTIQRAKTRATRGNAEPNFVDFQNVSRMRIACGFRRFLRHSGEPLRLAQTERLPQ